MDPAPALVEGSTLDPSPTNQPTNNTQPLHYVSVRLTISHAIGHETLASYLSNAEYIAYPHVGTKTQKEHWHVAIIGGGTTESWRLRFKRWYKLAGNQELSVKAMENGIMSFITYAAKEKTQPSLSPCLQQWVDAAPVWVNQVKEVNLMDDKGVRDWTLTYSNLVAQATRYAKRNGLDGGLKDVVREMLKHTKWRPSRDVIRSGVPEHYENDFEFRMSRRADPPMAWYATKQERW